MATITITMMVVFAASVGTVVAGDAKAGKKIYTKKCKACHLLTAKKKVGPGFKGVYGRESAEKGMKGYNLDDAGMTKWLKTPKKIFPKSKMAKLFKKKLKGKEIEDVIEFLKTVK